MSELTTDNPVPMFADPAGFREAAKNDPPRETVRESASDEFDDLFQRSVATSQVDETPKRRGRPRGTKNKATVEKELLEAQAALKKLEEQISGRAADMMIGVTGLASIFRADHIQMTQAEADAIAIPLASYMASRYEQVEWVGQVIDRWDLVAVSIGVATYLIRVWKDDLEYRAREQQRRNTRGATGPRREAAANSDGRTEQESPRFGESITPYGTFRVEYGTSSGDSGQEQSPDVPS